MKNNWFLYLLGIIAIIVLLKQCEGTDKVVIKTVTEYVYKTDTVTNTIIQKVDKPVYVNKVKTVKGKDSIIYVTTPNDSTIKANQFKTKLESNNASADLTITTTGELLDVQGVINYTQENKTTTTTTTKSKSGFYIYAKTPINSVQPEVGALYQFKNKLFISAGAQYNSFTKSADFNIGLGVKIF